MEEIGLWRDSTVHGENQLTRCGTDWEGGTREVHVRLLLDTFRKTPAARFSLLSLGLIRSSQTLISRELANAGIYFANFRLASA